MECIKPQHEKQIQRQNTPLRQITPATMNMISFTYELLSQGVFIVLI